MDLTGSKLKFSLKILSGLIGFAVIGFLLILLSFILPREKIIANIKEAASQYSDYSQWAQGIPATINDSFSDSIMLSSAAYEGKESLSQSAVLINRYTYDEIEDDPMTSLNMKYGDIAPGSKQKIESYPRYWHGYLIFLTPLLEILNPAQIIFLNAIGVFSLSMILVAIAYKRHGIKLATSLGIFIVSLNPISIALNFQYSTVFYPTILAIIAILLWDRWLQKNNRYLFFFFFLGCITVYLDLLTYPLVSLGAPLALIIYLRNYNINKLHNIISPLKTELLASGLWGIGYAGTWALKWAISSIILHENMFAQAIEQMKFRVGGEAGHLETIKSNLEAMFNEPMILFILILIIIIIILLITRKISFRWRKWDLLVYIVISSFPFIWYLVLCNHSYNHSWFTYRELSIAVFAASLIIANSFVRRLPSKRNNPKSNLNNHDLN